MSRYLVTGAGGMLGADLVAALRGREFTALTRRQLDITDAEAVHEAVAGHDVVFNAAAYTRVDEAETHEEQARAVNAIGAGNVAQAAAAHGARLVQFSTDYVFEGTGHTPYPEDAPRRPISAYGRTKAEGEQLVLAAHGAGAYIVRTAWLYGQNGPNFATTMLALAAERDTVQVVDDQRGQPTWTADLARQAVALLDATAPPGIYHGTSAGETTWFGFAQAIFQAAGLDPARVEPTDSAHFRRAAPRPAYSVLGHDAWRRARLRPIRSWRDALQDAITTGALR